MPVGPGFPLPTTSTLNFKEPSGGNEKYQPPTKQYTKLRKCIKCLIEMILQEEQNLIQ